MTPVWFDGVLFGPSLVQGFPAMLQPVNVILLLAVPTPVVSSVPVPASQATVLSSPGVVSVTVAVVSV